ncbi:MAG: GTPase ObgE [Planctomycetes bacterium]|nr:GTPase ObgE [Planctomycetota bacterium]
MPNMFHDEAEITISSGKGGDGCVSFRREKFVPEGGPDGGDGGDGGAVVFITNPHLNTLSAFIRRRHWKAKGGMQGGGSLCSGKKGEDMVIEVPQGTLIRHGESGELLADMRDREQRVVLAAGGIGGYGNTHFKKSTNQTPRKAGIGTMGTKLPIKLELKLIADVGLIGFPNAGKSTLLSCLSHATPKIASYPFTTLTPQLGVIELPDRCIVVADIPGLIEGASDGHGLGHQFLRHIERCSFFIHLLDASEENAEELQQRHDILNKELQQFSPLLAQRQQMVVLNKSDVRADIDEVAADLAQLLGSEVQVISGVTQQGLRELKNSLLLRLHQLDEDAS